MTDFARLQKSKEVLLGEHALMWVYELGFRDWGSVFIRKLQYTPRPESNYSGPQTDPDPKDSTTIYKTESLF